jgi:hypothetical protein
MPKASESTETVKELLKFLPIDDIKHVSMMNDTDPALVASIVLVESGGSQGRTRYEPGWKYFYQVEQMAKRLGPTRDLKLDIELETRYQATSWGLMQVMGAVARELGMRADLPLLIMPYTNLTYGCKLLSKLKGRWPNFADQIAAYNAGSPRKNREGTRYENQGYVDKVMGWYSRIHPIISDFPKI